MGKAYSYWAGAGQCIGMEAKFRTQTFTSRVLHCRPEPNRIGGLKDNQIRIRDLSNMISKVSASICRHQTVL
eukprot:4231527-Karenia_brevis.AAC.1